MWGKLQNLNKLQSGINKWKELAVDAIAPRVPRKREDGGVDHDDEDDVDDDDEAIISEDRNTLQYQQHRQPAPDDLHRIVSSLERELEQQTARCRALEVALTNHSASTASIGSNSSAEDIEKAQAALKEAVRERDDVVARAQAYAADAQKHHLETVSFYESKLQASATQLTAEQSETVKLRETLATLQRRCAELEEEQRKWKASEVHSEALIKGAMESNKKAEAAKRALEDEVATLKSALATSEEQRRGEHPISVMDVAAIAKERDELLAEVAAFRSGRLKEPMAATPIENSTEISKDVSHFEELAASASAKAAQLQKEVEAAGVQLAALRVELEHKSTEFDAQKRKLDDEKQFLVSALQREGAARVDLEQELQAARREVEQSRASVASLESSAHVRDTQLAQTKQQYDFLRAEMESLQRSKDCEAAIRGHEEQTLQSTRSRLELLEAEQQRLSAAQSSIVVICRDAFQSIGVTPQLPAAGNATPADMVSHLASECVKFHKMLMDAQRVQQQWEQTYAQAKDVNTHVATQLKEANRAVSELRGELHIRETTIAALKDQLRSEAAKTQGVEHVAVQQQEEAQRRAAFVDQLREQLRESDLRRSALEERLNAQHADMEHLRAQLQDKEEELSVSLRAASNLQMVLEQFQSSKQRDVEERTLYLQHELDQVRAEVVAMEAAKQQHRDDLESLVRNHRKETAAKNVVISGLQAKLAELKRVLEETASQLSDEHMIDKRVVSHLVVNFVHSVALQRGDEEDMLKVMSGLLNWDELMQQKAGLIPGSLNPQRLQRRGGLGGLVKSVWGGFKSAPPSEPKTTAQQAPRSIAEMWVEFLVQEADRSGGGPSSQETETAVSE